MLVSATDADTIERQWELVAGALRMGHSEASFEDLRAGLEENARKGLWGQFRNTLLTMAAQADVRRDWRTAFRGHLEVCYIDANGPCNGSPDRFRPHESFVAHGVVRRIAEL